MSPVLLAVLSSFAFGAVAFWALAQWRHESPAQRDGEGGPGPGIPQPEHQESGPVAPRAAHEEARGAEVIELQRERERRSA